MRRRRRRREYVERKGMKSMKCRTKSLFDAAITACARARPEIVDANEIKRMKLRSEKRERKRKTKHENPS